MESSNFIFRLFSLPFCWVVLVILPDSPRLIGGFQQALRQPEGGGISVDFLVHHYPIFPCTWLDQVALFLKRLTAYTTTFNMVLLVFDSTVIAFHRQAVETNKPIA
jgi:hypothetical protein